MGFENDDHLHVKIVKSVDVVQISLDKIHQDEANIDMESFFICNLGEILDKYKLAVSLLPNFSLSYNVSSCNDINVITAVSQLGCHFTCTNKAEIQLLRSLKVDPSKISFTSPCKQSSHLKYAANAGIQLVAADSESEIRKISSKLPHAKLIIPVRTEFDGNAMSWSSGIDNKKLVSLLKSAQHFGLTVSALSASCGDLTNSFKVCEMAKKLRTAFDVMSDEGIVLEYVEVSDSFPSHVVRYCKKACQNLAKAMDYYFPSSLGVKVFVQCGQLLVDKAFTLCSTVLEKRSLYGDLGEWSYDYSLSDGVYGAFSRLLTDPFHFEPPILLQKRDGGRVFNSCLYGPSGDSLDCLLTDCKLVELYVGDWVMFEPRRGLQLVTSQSDTTYYVMDESHWFALCCRESSIYNESDRRLVASHPQSEVSAGTN